MPATGVFGGESPFAVIVGIADHHLRIGRGAFVERRIDGAQAGGHQCPAETLVLARWHHRDRSHHDQRVRAAPRIGQRDRPELDGTGEVFFLVQRGEAEAGQPVGTLADPVGGARMATLAESGVEQLLDQCGIDRRQGDEYRHGPRHLEPRPMAVDQFRLIRGEVPAAGRLRRLPAPTARRRALR